MYHVIYNKCVGKTLRTNANVQNNPREMSVRSYSMFLWLRIIESIGNTRAFPSYNFTYSYDSTYKDVFAPAYLLGYTNQFSPWSAPEKNVWKIPVTNYTYAYQHAPHAIIHFYILLQFYIRRHFLRQPVTCARKYYPR